MNALLVTKLYELLSNKIGKDSAENLTSYIEEKIKDEMENKTYKFATKDDIALVKEEIAQIKEDAALNKAEIIKWMFVFWVAQAGTTFGIILMFLKK